MLWLQAITELLAYLSLILDKLQLHQEVNIPGGVLLLLLLTAVSAQGCCSAFEWNGSLGELGNMVGPIGIALVICNSLSLSTTGGANHAS